MKYLHQLRKFIQKKKKKSFENIHEKIFLKRCSSLPHKTITFINTKSNFRFIYEIFTSTKKIYSKKKKKKKKSFENIHEKIFLKRCSSLPLHSRLFSTPPSEKRCKRLPLESLR